MKLNLNKNKISDEGVKYLSNALINNKVSLMKSIQLFDVLFRDSFH